ncbi:MAG: YCF48-related protein [Bacteroidales bacterium]|nr:YCF48-related protein [Bacteroidales bacterium]
MLRLCNIEKSVVGRLLLCFISVCFICNLKAQWHYHSSLSTAVPNIGSGIFRDVDFISESTGMYCFEKGLSPSSGTRVIVKGTTDNGISWLDVFLTQGGGYSTYTIKAVKNRNTFFHIRNNGGFYIIDKFVQGGNSYQAMIQRDGFFRDISVVDTSVFYILKTVYLNNHVFIDKYAYGQLYSRIDSFLTILPHRIFFTNENTGYMTAGHLQNTAKHHIYKSETGGDNWFEVFSDSTLNLNHLFFSSLETGYAAGDSGKIIKTDNAGQTWQHLNSQTLVNLNGLYFINDSVGYVTGDSGVILKTLNGGISWHEQKTDTTLNFSKIFFVNDSVGFALSGNTLYKTIQHPRFITSNMKLDTKSISIFPNPSSGLINIQGIDEKSDMLIINLLGEVVNSYKGITGDIMIDLSHHSKGIYIIFILQEKNIKSTSKIAIIQ